MKKTVLVIDDHPQIQRMIKLRLAKQGYNVQIAESGKTALALLTTSSVDIILLDQMMPDMNGLETFEAIKEQLDMPPPVIMFSAHGTFDLVLSFMQAGGADFIQKPIDFEILDIKLQRAIRSSERLQQEISERKQAEMALRDSEERLRSTITSMDDLIFVLDKENRFIDFYQPAYKRNLDWQPEKFLNKQIMDVFPPEIAAAALNAISEVRKSGGVRQIEHSYPLNGQDYIFNAKLSIRRDSEAQFDGIVAVVRDVTEYRQAQKSRELLRQKNIRSAAIVTAQEQERRRISRELHDGLGQILTAIKFNINNLTEKKSERSAELLKQSLGLLDNAIAESERISQNMMPRTLDDFGLVPALYKLCNQTNNHSDCQVDFFAHGLKKRLNDQIEVGIYRITQEALNNMIKYAEASECAVQLVQHDDWLSLTVEDDGNGFEVATPATFMKKRAGMGLLNMQERAEALNGTFTIDASPGKGAIIIVKIPLTGAINGS